ncbi:Vacuolar protein-sorting-associated protein 27 [Thecaphora frezii]
MSALWSGWGADPFTEQVEKATSELLPAGQEDIALNLDICDQVRAKQVQPKQAMQIIKRRISHRNPNVVLLALGLTDICIKNGGDHFLQEVASREFMDNLVSVLRNPSGVNHDVKAKALGLIQNWAQIAEAKPAQMGYIDEVYRTLKSDKFEFPPRDPTIIASAALVETMTAPEWVDSDVCMRCRTTFTTFTRKHHCRNCGNVFCQQCSSHSMSLPWFGIGQDVRVCDACHARKAPPKNATKLSRSKSASSRVPSGRDVAATHHRSQTLGGRPRKAAAGSSSAKEDDDLALAIKLSLESAGGRSGASGSSAPNQMPSQPGSASHRATRQPDGRMLEGTDADDDPDLAAAIAASLRDWAPPQPSAPDSLPAPQAQDHSVERSGAAVPARENLNLPPSLELPPNDVDSLLTFAQTVQAQEAYNQRHGISGAPPHQQAQALYEKASAARPKVARSLEEGRRRHGVLVSMHDKLTEAVRLYDQLLDAQLARPSAAYASNLAPSYDQAPAAYYGREPHLPFGSGPPQQLHQPSVGVYPSMPVSAPSSAAATAPSPVSFHHQQHHHHHHHQHLPPASSLQVQPMYPEAVPFQGHIHHAPSSHSSMSTTPQQQPQQQLHHYQQEPYSSTTPVNGGVPAANALGGEHTPAPTQDAYASASYQQQPAYPNVEAYTQHPSSAVGMSAGIASNPHQPYPAYAMVSPGSIPPQSQGYPATNAYGGAGNLAAAQQYFNPSQAQPPQHGEAGAASASETTGVDQAYLQGHQGQPGGETYLQANPAYAEAQSPTEIVPASLNGEAAGRQPLASAVNGGASLPHFEKLMSPGHGDHAAQQQQQQNQSPDHQPYQSQSQAQPLTQQSQQHAGFNLAAVNANGYAAAPESVSVQRRRSTDTLVSSSTGWNNVPIEQVSPAVANRTATIVNGDRHHANGQPRQPQQEQQTTPTLGSPTALKTAVHYQPASNASYLPIFPVAPHPDNGLGGSASQTELVSPKSANTNGRSSAGMWQQPSVPRRQAQQVQAVGESPLIEF